MQTRTAIAPTTYTSQGYIGARILSPNTTANMASIANTAVRGLPEPSCTVLLARSYFIPASSTKRLWKFASL